MSDVIAITGLGMTTALGYDAPTACAAARAGLLRLRRSRSLISRGTRFGAASR